MCEGDAMRGSVVSMIVEAFAFKNVRHTRDVVMWSWIPGPC